VYAPALYVQVNANRYVFLTGQDDFNKDLTKTSYRKYQSAGLRNIHLMHILEMSHDLPGTTNFRKTLNYLDDREQRYRLIAPKHWQLLHSFYRCGKKGMLARQSLHQSGEVQ